MTWPGMNLQSIVTPQITSIVPERPISLLIYDGYSNDAAGNVTPNYTQYNNLYAQVQLENHQNLVHVDGYNETKIYKRFYIQSFRLTGNNRNLDTGGDYILMDSLYYKIVQILDNFKTGWVCVIGCESTELNG